MKTKYLLATCVLSSALAITSFIFAVTEPVTPEGKKVAVTIASNIAMLTMFTSGLSMYFFQQKYYPFIHLKAISVGLFFATIFFVFYVFGWSDQNTQQGVGFMIFSNLCTVGTVLLHIPFFRAPKLMIE